MSAIHHLHLISLELIAGDLRLLFSSSSPTLFSDLTALTAFLISASSAFLRKKGPQIRCCDSGKQPSKEKGYTVACSLGPSQTLSPFNLREKVPS